MKLKPTTSYTFNGADYDFILELCKVGYVNLLSSQVSLVSNNEKSLSFKMYGAEGSPDCNGLQLPPNWYIEHIAPRDGGVSVTFGVKKLP